MTLMSVYVFFMPCTSDTFERILSAYVRYLDVFPCMLLSSVLICGPSHQLWVYFVCPFALSLVLGMCYAAFILCTVSVEKLTFMHPSGV